LNEEKSECRGETYSLIGRKKLYEIENDAIAMRVSKCLEMRK